MQLFPSSSGVDTAIRIHYMDANLTYGEKSLTVITQECCEQYWTSPGTVPVQHSTKKQVYSHLPPITKTVQVRRIRYAGQVRTNSKTIYSSGTDHMDEQRQDGHLEPIYNSSVLIQDVALKTYRERWTIETGGERGSGRWRCDMMMMMIMKADEIKAQNKVLSHI